MGVVFLGASLIFVVRISPTTSQQSGNQQPAQGQSATAAGGAVAHTSLGDLALYTL